MLPIMDDLKPSQQHGQRPDLHHSRHTSACAHPDVGPADIFGLAAALVMRSFIEHQKSGHTEEQGIWIAALDRAGPLTSR
jgi:hypothetical protein